VLNPPQRQRLHTAPRLGRAPRTPAPTAPPALRPRARGATPCQPSGLLSRCTAPAVHADGQALHKSCQLLPILGGCEWNRWPRKGRGGRRGAAAGASPHQSVTRDRGALPCRGSRTDTPLPDLGPLLARERTQCNHEAAKKILRIFFLSAKSLRSIPWSSAYFAGWWWAWPRACAARVAGSRLASPTSRRRSRTWAQIFSGTAIPQGVATASTTPAAIARSTPGTAPNLIGRRPRSS